MFNFMSVLVLLPLEAITGYLYALSKALIDATPGLKSGEKPPDILKALTIPFTSKMIKVDKGLIKKIAAASMIADESDENQEKYDVLQAQKMLKHLFGNEDVDASDTLVGVLVLLAALAILCVSLFIIVYLLKSILKGQVAVWLHKSVNGQVPDIRCGGRFRIPMGWLSGYLAMAVGMGLTICVQSSSITTSALTPLVGIGVLKVERMYPTVLGANIGTCITGVLAALAADATKLYLTLQVAYAHLFFNLTGIFIWYSIWPLRAVPIRLAKTLGDTTAKYRWFALAYLAVCFFIVPAVFMGFSLAGDVPLLVLITLCIIVAVFVTVVNVLQTRYPERLPHKLRTWTWLPEPMRSLRPYDEHISRLNGPTYWRHSSSPWPPGIDSRRARLRATHRDEPPRRSGPQRKAVVRPWARPNPPILRLSTPRHIFAPMGRFCICCKTRKPHAVDLKNVKAELAPSNSELAIAAERM